MTYSRHRLAKKLCVTVIARSDMPHSRHRLGEKLRDSVIVRSVLYDEAISLGADGRLLRTKRSQ